ncbi:MAG: transporter [Silvibacterium sp.]|nr:transporter [Silvibacterium sp.]
MCKRLAAVCFALIASAIPGSGRAQFTDPRTYVNSPVGLNQLEMVYAYARSDTSVDTSLIITGASLNLNQGMIDYTRYFGFLHRLAWVQPALPIAGTNGSISGTNIGAAETGTGDSGYQAAWLLKGGPALSVEQFANFKPATTLGVSLTMTAPTGQYNSNKIINLGSDRWSFKPEIGLSQPFGPGQKWEFDAYANAYFYTDNTSYHRVEVLSQEPLPGLEGHISYSFSDNIWAAVDTRYSFRGNILVSGVNQNASQQNFLLGTELSVSLNAKNTLIFEFADALAHQNGPAIKAFAVKYDYTWGKGYK